MITPLKKHRGQNGVVIALVVLVASIAVVWATHPKPKPPAETSAVVKPRAAIEPPASSAVVPLDPSAEPKTVAPTRGIAGEVTYDERVTWHTYAPVSGWLEKIAIKPGKKVRGGETLGSLYSVEVYTAEMDLVTEVKAFRSQEALDIARRKLARWAMPRPLIDKIEKTGEVSASLPFVSYRPGTVVLKPALAGMYVESGTELFTVTDPSRAWVLADVTDPRVEVGTAAKLTFAGIAKPITAKVAHIYKTYDEGTRKARFDLQVPVKPGTAVTVEFP